MDDFDLWHKDHRNCGYSTSHTRLAACTMSMFKSVPISVHNNAAPVMLCEVFDSLFDDYH